MRFDMVRRWGFKEEKGGESREEGEEEGGGKWERRELGALAHLRSAPISRSKHYVRVNTKLAGNPLPISVFF